MQFLPLLKFMPHKGGGDGVEFVVPAGPPIFPIPCPCKDIVPKDCAYSREAERCTIEDQRMTALLLLEFGGVSDRHRTRVYMYVWMDG